MLHVENCILYGLYSLVKLRDSGARGMGNYYRVQLSLWDNQEILDMDSGDGCTHENILNASELHTYK